MASKSFVFRFDDVEVREREFSLVKAGEVLTVEPKAFRTLLFLLRNPQRLISKEELLNAVWGDTAVGDGSLTRSIFLLRRLLGDDTRNPRYIETVATVGYRFVCKVELAEDARATMEQPNKPGQTGGDSVGSTGNIDAPAPQVQIQNGTDGEAQTGPKKKQRGLGLPKWLLPGAVICVAGLVAAVWYLRRPLPPPQITAYTKITHDGRLKRLVGTDGNRLYFNQNSPNAMAQVGVTGGETAQIPVTVPHFDRLVDVSPDGSSFLIGSPVERTPGHELWSVRQLGGSFRRLTDAATMGAAFSPDGNWVAYSTYEGDIYVVRSDGTGAHKLATPGGLSRYLTWSPDGSTIRFSNDGWICEMSSNGSNLHRVLPAWHTSDQRGGRWSPDGKFFLLLSGRQIWAIDERRRPLRHSPTEPIRLTSGPINWERPVASKDGKKIFAVGTNPRGELSRFDSQSKQFSPFLGGISAESVSFSKDGRFITYVSFPEGILWKANRDGSSPVQLTEPPIYVVNPRWSPDGTQIVFNDLSSDTIYIVSTAGSSPGRLLPNDKEIGGDPSWSADGRKIVFSSGVGGGDPTSDLRILDMTSHRVTALPGSVGTYSPRWSPDGRYIAALLGAGLQIFDVQTQRWSALITPADPNFPTWARDSRFIYFLRYGPDQGVYRIRPTGGEAERVADLKDMHLTGYFGFWFGLDPTDAPLLLRDIGSDDIYALTLEEK